MVLLWCCSVNTLVLLVVARWLLGFCYCVARWLLGVAKWLLWYC